jgi:peptidoglycan/xylan/chitin deacetylase (PgdA/CDA1 family)
VRGDDLELQLALLRRSRRAVDLDAVIEFVAGRRELAGDSVLVTIDDGCLSTLSEALPRLARYGIPAVAFVTAGLVGTNAAADHGERYLDWDELQELSRGGVEIGSHAFDHRSFGRLSIGEALDQARRSRERLESRLGKRVRAFAYPFGMRPDFSASTDAALREAGYEIAFHSLHGAISQGMDLVSLPRVKIEGGEGLRMFERSCTGAMDSWRIIDEGLGHLRLRTARAETAAPVT